MKDCTWAPSESVQVRFIRMMYAIIPDRRYPIIPSRENLTTDIGYHYRFDGIPPGVFGGPSVNCRWPNVTSDTPTERSGGLPAKLWPFLPRAVNSHANHSYVVLPARAQHNSPRAELLDATAAAAAPATAAAGTRSMREEAVNQTQATSKISWSREGRLSYRSSTHRRKLSALYGIIFEYLTVIQEQREERLDWALRLNIACEKNNILFLKSNP